MNLNPEQGAQVAKAANVATYGGSGGAVFFGLSANEVGVYGGLLIALVGLIVNWYYSWKRDRREGGK